MTPARRFGALAALALTLVLGACSTPADVSVPTSEATNALITDADLDRAALEVAAAETEITGVETGVAPDGARLESSVTDTPLSAQAVLPNTTGYVTYIRISSGTWQLWLANQSNDQNTLVYRGNRTISSTTVNLAGNTLFFTAQVTAGSSNYEVYKLTLGNNVTTKLTTTTAAEADVSVSADGLNVVWGGVNPSGGKRAVFSRTYSGSSFTQNVLGVSNGDQYEPTVSGDGAYIALLRQTSSAQVVRFQKSNNSYLTVATLSSSVYGRTPSVSNGGLKVAWGEDNRSNEGGTVKVKTISGGSTLTAVSSSSRIRQPQLTSDGTYLTYAGLYNGAINVFTKNLTSAQVVQLTSDASPVVNTGMFWQKGADPVVVRGTVSSGSNIRVKLFQGNGALLQEIQTDAGRNYSFGNIASGFRIYLTAYEDLNGDGVQNSDERAGAFGSAALPQQLRVVSGTYTANITLTTPTEIEANDSASESNVLLPTTYINGYIESGDNDYFKLFVPTTGTYTLETTGSCAYSDPEVGYDPDTYIYLSNSAGTQLASNDDYEGYCSFLAYNFTQVGTYYVRVRDFSEGPGYYTLSFGR